MKEYLDITLVVLSGFVSGAMIAGVIIIALEAFIDWFRHRKGE